MVFYPSLDDVRKAHLRIKSYIHRTPVFSSRAVNQIAKAECYFKCENFQKTGAFKFRGACNAILSLTEVEASRGVVTHSSGNHAAALSLAAQIRKIPANIVMPKNTPKLKIKAVQGYGGQITFCEPTLKEREKTALQIIQETGAIEIHPNNDNRIIAGQGTAALELLKDVPDLDMIFVPVGGGGIMSGTAITVRGIRPDIKVIGCEPENADDAYRSLQAGRIIRPEKTDTIADGLRTALGNITFAVARDLVHEIVLISEEEIMKAMRMVFERMKLVIEPSSAVAFAGVLFNKIPVEKKKIGIVLTGGNVDLSRFFDVLI